ncbi:MAG: DUF1631 family protein, partial [Gallionellaceae bacterium]|nr:DUF1631 family protein [Gallionellaceae bacterium]
MRLKTRETARLSISTEQPELCEIHDFSEGGLQLVGLDPAAEAAAASQDARVEIEFPLNENGVGQHRLQGALVRRSASGLGLKLDSMTDEAYQALVNARSKIDNAPGTGLKPDENQAIVRDCIHLFHVFLDRAWQGFLDGIAVKVAERDTATLHLSDHSRYLGALANLLQRGDEIGRGLYASLVSQMYRMAEPKKELELLPDDSSELAILDDRSFDDWLNLAHIFQYIEADNRAAMYLFSQCFSRLTPVPIDRHNDPFGPEAVCLAFQDNLREVDLNNQMRSLIYKVFGEAIAPRYPSLYEQLNQLLAPLKPARQERLGSLANAPAAVRGGKPESERGDIAEQIDKLAKIAEQLF